MAFMEGQREVGIRLLSDIMGACPDAYVTMMRERNERNATDDARRSRKDANGRDSQPNTDDGPRDDASDLYDSDGDTVPSEPAR